MLFNSFNVGHAAGFLCDCLFVMFTVVIEFTCQCVIILFTLCLNVYEFLVANMYNPKLDVFFDLLFIP